MKIKIQQKGNIDTKFGFINVATGLPIRKVSRYLKHGIATEAEARQLLTSCGYEIEELGPVIEQTTITYNTNVSGQPVTGWENACKGAEGEALNIVSNTVNEFNGTVILDGIVTTITGTSTVSYLSNNLTHIDIPSSVSVIGTHAFCDRGITEVQLPTNLTSIGDKAFSACEALMSSITVPEGVTSIGKRAFYGSYYIPSISLPSTVTSIGDFAFGSCVSLGNLICNAVTPPVLGPYIFDDDAVPFIMVPAAGINSYKGDSDWSYYADHIYAI